MTDCRLELLLLQAELKYVQRLQRQADLDVPCDIKLNMARAQERDLMPAWAGCC